MFNGCMSIVSIFSSDSLQEGAFPKMLNSSFESEAAFTDKKDIKHLSGWNKFI